MNEVVSLDENTNTNTNTNTNKITNTNTELEKIVFQVYWKDCLHNISIQKDQLQQWRVVSDYIDVLLNYTKHDSSIIEIQIPKSIDLYTLLTVFRFFEKNQITKLSLSENQTVLQALAFFGVQSKMLQNIRRGLGMMYELHPLDIELENDNQVHDLTQSLYTEFRTKFSKNERVIKSFYYYKLMRSMKHVYPISKTIDQILSKFHDSSYFVFQNVDHILVCGSRVLNLFCHSQISTNVAFDVFFTTLDETIALSIIELIQNKIETKLKCQCHIAVTSNSVILFCEFIVIQFVTCLFESTNYILNSIDLDCCCVGISNNTVFAMSRFVRSLEYGGNIFQPEKQMFNYVYKII